MENYVKAILYGYPLLESVEEDYQEHIQVRALLSYRSDKSATEIAEYIAGEIVEKGRLVWLKSVVGEILEKLSDGERTLIAIRYLRTERKIKKPLQPIGAKTAYTAWSESKYFRMQQRLGEKVGAMLKKAGVTKELFEALFMPTDIFGPVYRCVCEGKDRGVSKGERRRLNDRALTLV